VPAFDEIHDLLLALGQCIHTVRAYGIPLNVAVNADNRFATRPVSFRDAALV
jgi:hypothetical protein